MTDTVKVKIGVLVGSNGRASAIAFHDGQCDWSFLTNELADWDDTQGFIYPDETRRYVVAVDVEPPAEPTEITATAEAVE